MGRMQGSKGRNSEASGDGSFSSRGMANSKREWVHVPTDEEILRQFGAKEPRVVARRIVVSELMRGGARGLQIQEILNKDVEQQNLKLRKAGLKELKPITMATVRKDMQMIKRSQLQRWFAKSPQRIADMFDALEISVQRSEQLWQRGQQLMAQADSWDERLKASEFQLKANIQNVDAVRSLLKALGVSDNVRVTINSEDAQERVRKLDAAPRQVRMKRQEDLIDATAEQVGEVD